MNQLPPLPFPEASELALADQQLRHNLATAIRSTTARRAAVVAELSNWAELREAGRRIRDDSLMRLDELLLELAERVGEAGGQVHWARDKQECNRIVADVIHAGGGRDVVKMKSLVTEETGLNEALAREGVRVQETDLAELILQFSGETRSHIGVPSLHLNRRQIQQVLARAFELPDLPDDPQKMCEAARDFLRDKFLRAHVGITGANFAVAETGSICIVESEGNGRMCVTMPPTLVTIMGIEKVLANWEDLAVMLRLLPRSSSGERMTPYVSVLTGTCADDGPVNFHLVLYDGGRSRILADATARQTLRCIRCSACLDACPVYERTGGHAYRSVYSGPIGAILTPQLEPTRTTASLPFASSLCGACYDVCPVKIDIPRVLVHLRGRFYNQAGAGERLTLRQFGAVLGGQHRFQLSQRLLQLVNRRPLSLLLQVGMAGWVAHRDLPAVPAETFRRWWLRTKRMPR